MIEGVRNPCASLRLEGRFWDPNFNPNLENCFVKLFCFVLENCFAKQFVKTIRFWRVGKWGPAATKGNFYETIQIIGLCKASLHNQII